MIAVRPLSRMAYTERKVRRFADDIASATTDPDPYWVIDVNARTLLVLRDPAPVGGNGHAYRSSRTLTEADTVTPLVAPNATLRVADLLP